MEKSYFLIFRLFNCLTGKLFRILLLIIPLLAYFAIDLSKEKLIGIYFLILINEIFIESLEGRKIKEGKTIFSYKAFALFNKKKSIEAAEEAEKTKEVKFILEKLGIPIEYSGEVEKRELKLKTEEILGKIKFSYVIPVDFFVSYLLLVNEKTQILKNNGISEEDLITLLYWARHNFHVEEKTTPFAFKGSGAFDSLVYGWDYEVKKFANNLTHKVFSANPPSIVGREKELEKFIVALSKETANSVILVGDPGVGKTNIVEYFAYESYLGNIPPPHVTIFELFVDRLLSGVSSQGDLEERLTFLFADIAHSGHAIVFIQNIEVVFGGGGMNFDISGVLYEYLKSSSIRVIGTATQAAYSTYLKNKESVLNLFEFINFKEPEKDKAMLMLIEHVGRIERHYFLKITYTALKEVIILSSSYFPDKVLPGKAIKLLDEAANSTYLKGKKVLEKEDIVLLVEEKTRIILEEPTKNEKEKLVHLEEFLHKRVIGQDEAVREVSGALRRLRSGFVNNKRPISTFLFLGPTGVGKTETAKALAQSYFGDENAMIRLDMSEYQTQDQIKRLLGEGSGQEYIPGTIIEKIKKTPFSLVLLDEFEKAHPHLLDIFLQVLDEGRLTDNQGHTVSFTNTIIIATSNAGTELLRENQDVKKEDLMDFLLKNNIFKPELLNRFDEILVFKNLGIEDTKRIAELILKEELKKLEERQITVSFDSRVIEKIANEGISQDFGARNIRRYVKETVENYISTLILEDKITKGNLLNLSVDDNNNFTFLGDA